MTGPSVSVVVPNYNHASYLTSRIESILAQTYRDFELILLDDASTDESMEVLERYRDRVGVRIHRNERNSGSPFPQWNLGAGMAAGRYLWIAEADDEASPDFLGTLVALLDAHPDVAIAYCQSLRIDHKGLAHGDFSDWTDPLDKTRWLSGFLNDGIDEVSRFLVHRNTIVNASAVLMRRDVFLKSGGAPTEFRLVGDWITYARMLKLGNIAFTPLPLNRFRCHESSVRAEMDRRENSTHNLDENLAVLQMIAREFPVSPVTLAEVAIDRARWWRDCIQNMPSYPSLRWAMKTSRILAQFDGVDRWSLLDRYLRVRAWKTPGIRDFLGFFKNA